jgi:prepilin-type N-terminal cleavage/methylation domain-containing protein
MRRFRQGFTMIELVFVIVVIGILSSIAIPKLSATRDDAKVVAEVASLKQNIENLRNIYTAQGNSYNGGNPTLYMNTDCFRILLWHNTNGYQLYYAPYDVSHGGMTAGSCNYDQATKNMIYQGAVNAGLLPSITSSHNEIISARKLKL